MGTVNPNTRTPRRALVDRAVHGRLAECPYSFYFNNINWHYKEGTLRLRGCVPSFYMKQVLQTLLKDIDHVTRIVNDVDVVSSTGLSSVRPK